MQSASSYIWAIYFTVADFEPGCFCLSTSQSLNAAFRQPFTMASASATSAAEPVELWSTELGLPADCVEFCPAKPQLFVAGTYKLNEGGGERQGAVCTFQLLDGVKAEPLCLANHQQQQQPLPGVLDIKWAGSLLAAALADGRVQLYRVPQEREELELGAACQAVPPGSLALALAWTPGTAEALAVSCSDGSVSILRRGLSALEPVEKAQCHRFEAWCVAWDTCQSHVFYTGGDDCRLCTWDRRNLTAPTHSLNSHTMGVTSLAPHPCQEHLLASGSYDEQVLLWDSRSLSKPLSEANVGGGAWRLRWRIGQSYHMLAVAAMHGGACVFSHSPTGDLKRVCTFRGHKSMVYGIDWASADTLASCSFYDRRLVLWKHAALRM